MLKNPNPIRDQFPGWPLTISQFDNLGINAGYQLPKLILNQADQLIKIINEETSEIVNVYRITGNTIQPSLHENGTYTVVIGEGNKQIDISGMKSVLGENPETLELEI